MFLVSSPKPIDPQLRDLVEQIEQQSPTGVSVLAARQFRYSLYQTPVEVTISEPRKFNVLEEFILRAGIELSPAPTENELASVLGLDPVFVRNTTATLRKLQTLSVAPDSRITLTPQGRQFYEQGTVPQPPQSKQIYAVADSLRGNVIFLSSPLDEAQLNLPELRDFITIEDRIYDVSSLTLQEIQQQVQNSGLGLHVPEDGKVITSSKVTAPTQTIWQAISIFVIFDVLEDKVKVQVRREKKILEDASNWLNALQSEEQIFLKNLCGWSDEVIASERDLIIDHKNEEVEARIDEIQQKAIETAKKTRANGNNPSLLSAETGSVILLRDSQIRGAFLETINSARHNILLYSPWVSEEVVNDELVRMFQHLAKNGVWILIGYGIGRRQEDEDRPISPKVEQKLREVRTPEGLPAVQVFWLGNSHVKEIVVDKQVHLCSSHNWLSYRGDWLPRGETVYKVTNPGQVQAAYEFLAGRFQAHADKLWEAAMVERDSTLVEAPLCIWGALSLEEIALNQLWQNNFLELPVWLQIVRQGLRSGLTSLKSDALKAALDLLGEISEETPNIQSLRESWCQVMGAIATLDSDAAVTLLSDEAWTQFTRLGIVQMPIDSPEKFIAEYTVTQNKSDKSSKKERQNASNKQTKTRKRTTS